MSEIVTGLKISPGKHPSVTPLCDSDKYLNLAVSIDDFGAMHLAEARPLDVGVVVICARQSTALTLGGNRRVGKHILCGTFYIVGLKDGTLRSLTKDEITKYTSKFWEPELFAYDEVIDSWCSRMLCTL